MMSTVRLFGSLCLLLLTAAARPDTSGHHPGQVRYALLTARHRDGGAETVECSLFHLPNSRILWTVRKSGRNCWGSWSQDQVRINVTGDSGPETFFYDLRTGRELFSVEGQCYDIVAGKRSLTLNQREDSFHCVDPKTGRSLWSIDGRLSWTYTGRKEPWIVLRDENRRLLCVDGESGRELWSVNGKGNLQRAAGKLWMYNYGGRTIRALDPETGRKEGSYEAPDGITRVSECGKGILVQSQSELAVLSPDTLDPIWSVKLEEGTQNGYCWQVGPSLVLLSNNYALIRILDPDSGRELWEHETETGNSMSWNWAGDRLFFQHNRTTGKITAVDVRKRKLAWEREAEGFHLSERHGITIVQGTERLTALKTYTGEEIWSVRHAGITAWPCVIGSRFYFCEGDTLVTLDVATGKRLRRTALGGRPNYAYVSAIRRK